VDDNVTVITDHTQRYETPLAVVVSLVLTRHDATTKDEQGIEKVDTSPGTDALSLVFVPFELHDTPPKLPLNLCT